MSYSSSPAPGQSNDTVGVFDQNFNQLFPSARPISDDIKPEKKMMKHPVETGATIVDFQVFEPIQITIVVVLTAVDYIDTYSEIAQFYQGSSLANISTKVGFFPNMALAKMPHKEETVSFDTIRMNLEFVEVKFASPSASKALPASMTTNNTGQVNATPASTGQTSEATSKTQNSSALHSLIYGN